MKFLIHSVILAMVLSIPVASADSLPVEPGLWETTVTSTNSFTGTQTQTTKECVTIDAFDPKTLFKDAEGCKVVDSDVNGNVLTFSMDCNVDGGQGTFSGRYQSEGDTGSGEMNMEMSFNGQTMTMESTMESRRLGDC